MALSKYNSNSGNKENKGVNFDIDVDLDYNEEESHSLKSTLTSHSPTGTGSSPHGHKSNTSNTNTNIGMDTAVSVLDHDHHRNHLHNRTNTYNRMKGTGQREQDVKNHSNNIHTGNSIVTQLSSGKRLSSLRHALRRMDGSDSGNVAYSEFKEAIVNKLGLKIPDTQLRDFYNSNSTTVNATGPTANLNNSSSHSIGCYTSTTAGDVREKLVNIDDFICNMQCRASSKMFGLHKNSTISTPTNSTVHAKIVKERQSEATHEEQEYSAVTVEEERVIKKFLHASNKMTTTDPLKLFNDLASHHETDVGSYNDPCRMIPSVSVSAFKDGLSYMGASLSDGEFYTLANALTHHHDDNSSTKGSGMAELTGTGMDKNNIRINVKHAFDSMQKTVVLADQYNRKHRYDALTHNTDKAIRYTQTFKSNESIIDHYAHHLHGSDTRHKSSMLNGPPSDSATHLTGEYDTVGSSKTLKSNGLMWQKLKCSIQDKKESVLDAFQSVPLVQLDSDTNVDSNTNNNNNSNIDPTQRAMPWKTLKQELSKNGIVMGKDDLHQFEYKLFQNKKLENIDTGPVVDTAGSINNEKRDKVMVSLSDICNVVDIPVTIDSNHTEHAVLHHPMEAYNNYDGNIFASSSISTTRGGASLESNNRLCKNDSFSTTYMLDKHKTGEETTIYHKGNRRR